MILIFHAAISHLVSRPIFMIEKEKMNQFLWIERLLFTYVLHCRNAKFPSLSKRKLQSGESSHSTAAPSKDVMFSIFFFKCDFQGAVKF